MPRPWLGIVGASLAQVLVDPSQHGSEASGQLRICIQRADRIFHLPELLAYVPASLKQLLSIGVSSVGHAVVS